MRNEIKKFSGVEFARVRTYAKEIDAKRHAKKSSWGWSFRIVKTTRGYELYAKPKEGKVKPRKKLEYEIRAEEVSRAFAGKSGGVF